MNEEDIVFILKEFLNNDYLFGDFLSEYENLMERRKIKKILNFGYYKSFPHIYKKICEEFYFKNLRELKDYIDKRISTRKDWRNC